MENVDKKLEVVMNRLFHLKESDTEQTIESEKRGIFKRDFGMNYFDWPQGIGLYAIYTMYEETKDSAYMLYLDQWFQKRIKEGLPSKNINTTIPLLTLARMNEELKNPQYEDLMLQYRNFLLYDLPRTQERGFEHITSGKTNAQEIGRHEQQLWVDTIFMSCLFLAFYGSSHQDQECLDEAKYQMDLHLKYLFDEEKRLMYHGYSFLRKDHFAGAFWARGNAWFTLGLPLFLKFHTSLDSKTKELYLRILEQQIDALLSYQDGGMWHTLIDEPTYYIETSGSAGILGGILLAYNESYLKTLNTFKIEEGIKALLNHIDEEGNVLDVSCGTGIAITKEAYGNILKKPMAYGQSLMILCLLEYQKYRKKINEKSY